MISPPVWSEHDLERERQRAEEHFRQGRRTEPLELYLELFDDYQNLVEDVFNQTSDLNNLRNEAANLFADKQKLEVVRYLAGPPVSEDDLKTLIATRSLTANRFETNPDLTDRLVTFIEDWHDRRRFQWIEESRSPSETERNAAIIATTSILATRRLETMRRSQSKVQERLVATQLRRARFKEVPSQRVRVLAQAPQKGEFCRETMFGSRKADFLIGMPDGRVMALECKVSNSATNSIKRLNNDAAVKATVWRDEFGSSQVVTAAVLDGVYALRNLNHAQDKGLTLFWSHDITAMLDWIRSTDSGNQT